jgi:hypothetical protein
MQTAILKKYYVLPRRYWPDNDGGRTDLHASLMFGMLDVNL